LNNSSKAQTLLQSIFKLNKRMLVKGITCRSCAGTDQQVSEVLKKSSPAGVRQKMHGKVIDSSI
jgi:hypothetical protein